MKIAFQGISEHAETEAEPKSPIDICPSPVVKIVPICEVPSGVATTSAYPKPSEIKSANSVSRTNSNKIDEKTAEKHKLTVSGTETRTSENERTEVVIISPPVPVPPCPKKGVPPPPPLAFMGMIRKPPPQVRQLMWQPIKDSHLSKNGIWATDDVNVFVDDAIGDEILQLFKLTNQKAAQKVQLKQPTCSSTETQAENGEEMKNSGYTIGALRAQRLEMLFK